MSANLDFEMCNSGASGFSLPAVLLGVEAKQCIATKSSSDNNPQLILSHDRIGFTTWPARLATEMLRKNMCLQFPTSGPL